MFWHQLKNDKLKEFKTWESHSNKYSAFLFNKWFKTDYLFVKLLAMNFQSVILSALVARAPFASKWWVCANDDCLFCFETQSDWNANWLVNELTTITKKSRDTLAYRHRSSRKTRITHLCMSECNPGSCVQDIQLCRRRAGGDRTAAGGLPPVWDSGGSLRPGVPHRNGRRDDNLKAGEVKSQKGRLTVVENYKELFTWHVELKKYM